MRKIGTTLGIAAVAVVATAMPASAYPNQTLNPDTGPAGSHTLGYHYANSNGGGGYIRWIGRDACTGTTSDIDYGEASFSQESANDEISSFSDYNYCDTKWYINSSYGGAAYGYVNAGEGSPNNLPTNYGGTRFYDEVSSVRWS
ncbi:MAG: hypothetical protein ACRDVZ_10940 [Jiangellaceae bacterium]